MEGRILKTLEEIEAALAQACTGRYLLRLYVTGSTPRSSAAVANVKRICESYLAGRYELEVVDVYQQPELARSQELIAAPTLVKREPKPLRRIVGDMSNEERVLVGLDLRRQP